MMGNSSWKIQKKIDMIIEERYSLSIYFSKKRRGYYD